MELLLDSIQFSYDRGLPTERRVLDSISVRVRKGELLSIVGRTGSGKTTLGLIMAGLLDPTRGRVTLEDSSVSSITTVKTSVGDAGDARPRRPVSTPHATPPAIRKPEGADVVMVFQFPESQFFEESVFGEVAFGPSRQGLGDEAVRQRIVSAMQKMRLDFDALSDRSALTLSAGEKRRVAIASALSCDPRFLILDEPTVSLDWEASAHVFEILKELRSDGVSVIVMTHEMEDALAYSDRIAVLAEGKLEAYAHWFT